MLRQKESGFTIVELMVVIFLTGIAVIAIYRGYTSFSQAADAQEQIIEMQQNLRIGMHRLEKDLRRAGMNEENDDEAGFTEGYTTTVSFNMDLTGGATDGADNDNDGGEDNLDPDGADDEDIYGDGDMLDAGEAIEYYLVYDNAGAVTPVAGTTCPGAVADPPYPCFLFREDSNAGTGQKVISNVEAINFVYIAEDGTELVPGAGGLDGDQLKRVHGVHVTLLVRTSNEDFRFTNRETYENNSPFGSDVIFTAQGDNFRRRSFSKLIKIRNAGL